MLETLKRSDNIGSKKVIFMIRHENDLDFMMPIMLFACKPIVIFWGFIAKDDFRVAMLNKQGITPVYLDGLKTSILEKVCLRVLGLANKFLFKRLQEHLNRKSQEIVLSSFAGCLDKINPTEIDIVVFDHSVNEMVKTMITLLRAWNNSIKILSLPHGHGIVMNKLRKYSQIEPSTPEDWGIFDKVVFFNNYSAPVNESVNSSRKMVIPSLRNTKEWVDRLGKELAGADKNTLSNPTHPVKIRLLIIHTRMASNINYDEVVRCIKILDKFKCFDVRIKPHPRRINDALQLASMSEQVSLINGHITECIRWSHMVLFFQSSAVYDAFILNKPVIYPNYISSNEIHDEVLKYCHVLSSPDDFYALVKSLSLKEELEKPDYSPEDWSYLLDKWALTLSSPSRISA